MSVAPFFLECHPVASGLHHPRDNPCAAMNDAFWRVHAKILALWHGLAYSSRRYAGAPLMAQRDWCALGCTSSLNLGHLELCSRWFFYVQVWHFCLPQTLRQKPVPRARRLFCRSPPAQPVASERGDIVGQLPHHRHQ